jgi:hypothetical protein
VIESEPESLDIGGLWRDVVNFIGDRLVEPSMYLPLLDAVLPRWGAWTYFLGHAATNITKDRPELEADTARALLGWRLWTEQREGLRKFAETAAKRPVGDHELEAWWIRDERGEHQRWSSYLLGIEQAPAFARLTGLTADDERIIDDHPEIPEAGRRRRKRKHDWLVSWINTDLAWTTDLKALRTLAEKTWTADPHDRRPWTQDELEFVNGYYEEQQPSLYVPGDPEQIDPFELDTMTMEQNLGIGLDGLRYCMYVLMRAVMADFADSILERTRRPSSRGSIRCVECGLFVGRRALGYGQMYCSDRCKKRAAKRRYRGRLRATRTGPRLRIVE